MKAIIAFFIGATTLFLQLQAMAQKGEQALAAVTYEFIHVNDTNHKENPFREDMVLCLGPNSSKYRNRILENNERKVYKMILERPPVPSSIPTDGSIKVVTGQAMAVVYGRGITEEALYQHCKENRLNMTNRMATVNYLIESSLPKINWRMDTGTRNIGGYTCQKAVGDYAGRTYAAWFTTELPFRNGPWKLSGLPGLILEARDTKNEVAFLFKDISKDTAYRTTGALYPEDFVKVSAKAFERARETWLNDPQGVVLSQRPTQSKAAFAYVDSTGKYHMGGNGKAMFEEYRKETLANTNNPLELIKQ